MEPSKSEARAPLKDRLLLLLKSGALGSAILSSTVLAPSSASATTGQADARVSIEARVERLRQQQEAAPAAASASPKAEEMLAWGNWHNWRNGWPNGWHNWHNWGNW